MKNHIIEKTIGGADVYHAMIDAQGGRTGIFVTVAAVTENGRPAPGEVYVDIAFPDGERRGIFLSRHEADQLATALRRAEAAAAE